MYGERPSEEHLIETNETIGDSDDINDNVRIKGKAQRFMSQIGSLKRFSWSRLSTDNTTVISSDVTYSGGEEETVNYNSIENDGISIPTDLSEESDQENFSFWQFFLISKGPSQLVFLSLLFALALGSTVGVVPEILTQRYAEFYYGFDGICSDYDKYNKPKACLDGSSDAQSADATATFVTNIIIFLTSSLIGSLSDEYGRRSEYDLNYLLIKSSIGTIQLIKLHNCHILFANRFYNFSTTSILFGTLRKLFTLYRCD